MSMRNTMRLSRQFATAPTKANIPEGYFKLKQIQEHFQKPNGLPVHLKGGPLDRVLLGTTVVLCGVGLVGFGKLVFDLGGFVKSKPEE